MRQSHHQESLGARPGVRQHVIVIGGRFAAWELLVPDLDIMVRLDGRLEVSRGIVEAQHVTSERHSNSAVVLTNLNSCQLNSTLMTPTNGSRITSADAHESGTNLLF